MDSTSDSISKIRLFMLLFRGREDVYAKRWENKKKRTSGYSPVCLNQLQEGLCGKPRIPCAKCDHKSYSPLNEETIEDHLRGNIVVGIYPMLSDETCYFLAMDFDEADWQKDISAVRGVCTEFKIPIAVERSRSGQGGHIWFFFENNVSAALARKFGSALLTCAMGRRHEIRFQSYDRLFPSQDTMPKGGNWEKSNRIRSFISAVEEKVTEMATAPEVAERLKKWASWAQNHADSLDPLSEDKILSVIEIVTD